MCFFTHAVVLGVGYWIGKQYSDGYTVEKLPIDPTKPGTQEFVIRVEKQERRCGGFWGRGPSCQEKKITVEGEKTKEN